MVEETAYMKDNASEDVLKDEQADETAKIIPYTPADGHLETMNQLIPITLDI